MIFLDRQGASAIPFRWRRMIHGWPGLRARDLLELGLRTATKRQLRMTAAALPAPMINPVLAEAARRL